ncbi:MAG: hypothetical protein LBH39_06910 [Clostridiales Family XIII bacterium]|nr:hypothetical protein [Clostridiales Family XIII bacterium]
MGSTPKERIKAITKKLGIYTFISEQRAMRRNKTINAKGGSGAYWEERYSGGGTSGSGSYGQLQAFKAEVLNGFLDKHKIESAIEWGCGDGSQLGRINYSRYIGLDVSQTAVNMCRAKYAYDTTKTFYVATEYEPSMRSECALSLDVIFHLLEDDVYSNYMNNLFGSAEKFVCIYSSNFESAQLSHMRHRMFTDYIDTHWPDWGLAGQVKNRYPYNEMDPDGTSLADFYFYEYRA